MIIAAVADIHGDSDALSALGPVLARADYVLVAGDLTHFGGQRDAARVVDAIRIHNPKLVCVPGNCDPPAVSAYLTREGINLHGSCRASDGLGIIGLGGSLPCPRPTPFELDECQLARLLSGAVRQLPEDLPIILLSHQPPWDTCTDLASIGRHVGSVAVREFIESTHPSICFTGHIHESAGVDIIGSTHVANPGPARLGSYAWAEIEGGEVSIAIRTV